MKRIQTDKLNWMKQIVLLFIILFAAWGCAQKSGTLNPDKELDYCLTQINKSLPKLTDYSQLPRDIMDGDQYWSCGDYRGWTSGFWPGILWYACDYSGDDKLKAEADSFSVSLLPLSRQKATTHDLGFMVFCSLGNGYKETKNPGYKEAIVATADSLATLFNPVVGTILSWPRMVQRMGWPHNTIIDNMMNLELLFWASKNGGSQNLYDIAVTHAKTTMKNQFRDDYSVYHVVVYDTITGQPIKKVTHQGYSDESMWARGQAWAIYGFTMTARETKDPEFLQFAEKVAQVFIDRLPDDYVPYWDFDAPGIPYEPRDASAAAIAASAFVELSVLEKDQEKSDYYKTMATKILTSLSGEKYQSRNKNVAFLSHSTGHKPNNSEIDVPIIYADYYYIEALTRLKKLNEGQSIYL